VVGPAGPSLSKECNQLAERETVKSRDNYRCLSRRSVSNPLTAERLRELVDYSPGTGEFKRKVATSSNARVGEIAGCRMRGSWVIKINGISYLAHRLAFLHVTGKIPEKIRHLDNNGLNNRWANLSETPPSRDGLTAERLRTLFSYDPKTGIFQRRIALRGHAGQIAGATNSEGYKSILVDGHRYGAHRLAFLYVKGKFPKSLIDHADGDPANNAWSNLREATHSLNSANARRSRNNTSGFKGVYWHTHDKMWLAVIKVNRRAIYLGSFDTPDEAHSAYMAAAVKHWGEFAYCGEGPRDGAA
jgi:hypothetical protein